VSVVAKGGVLKVGEGDFPALGTAVGRLVRKHADKLILIIIRL
jgi:hypothetical protein